MPRIRTVAKPSARAAPVTNPSASKLLNTTGSNPITSTPAKAMQIPRLLANPSRSPSISHAKMAENGAYSWLSIATEERSSAAAMAAKMRPKCKTPMMDATCSSRVIWPGTGRNQGSKTRSRMAKRSPVNISGGKACVPNFPATQLNAQARLARSAKARCSGFMLEISLRRASKSAYREAEDGQIAFSKMESLHHDSTTEDLRCGRRFWISR